MMGFSKSAVMIAGAVLVLLGVLAIVVPIFTTEQTKDVANIGNLKLTATEETSHVIPPIVGPVALALGVILLGAGLFAKR